LLSINAILVGEDNPSVTISAVMLGSFITGCASAYPKYPRYIKDEIVNMITAPVFKKLKKFLITDIKLLFDPLLL
jgi:hypothetical protein